MSRTVRDLAFDPLPELTGTSNRLPFRWMDGWNLQTRALYGIRKGLTRSCQTYEYTITIDVDFDTSSVLFLDINRHVSSLKLQESAFLTLTLMSLLDSLVLFEHCHPTNLVNRVFPSSRG